MRRLLVLLATILSIGILTSATPLLAQPAPANPAADAAPIIDAAGAQLTEIEGRAAAPDLSDEEMMALRLRVDPVAERLRGLVDAIQPRIEAARARLEQLGPAPASGAPPESADLARERETRGRDVAQAEELQRRARAALVQAEQVIQTISDRRREAFTRTLFAQSRSVVDPELWIDALDNLPRDLRALQVLGADWLNRAAERARDGRIFVLLLAIVAAIVLAVAKRRFYAMFAKRDEAEAQPSRLAVALVAGARATVGSLPVAVASVLLYAALDRIYLLPLRTEPVAVAILGGIAFLAFARTLGDAVLVPGRPAWRLLKVDDSTAAILMRMIWIGSGIVIAAYIADAIMFAISAGLAITALTRGMFAIAFALALISTLRALGRRGEVNDEECLGPYVPAESRLAAPMRLAGWIASFAIIASAAFGFIALSSFIMNQIIWVATLTALLVVLIAIVDRGAEALTADGSRLTVTMQQMVGLRRRSLEQVTVLATGALRVVLLVIALLLALAPWGVQSVDVWSSLRTAFFGIKIGDYTLSLSAVFTAAILFAVGLALTRAVQRWLDQRYLPSTDMEPGLQNSIKTVFGYVGIIIAGAIAFAQLGLSFDRLTIVAGALSVGIGFGLQSIVSNFVSGLILLGERPIKVGDRILVGADEGIVKRINVRATEIETGDRAILMVPNSTLITGVVRNRVRNDRTGRALVTIVMPRASDPGHVKETLMAVAKEHPKVLREPGPVVLFKKIGETTLEFDLIAIVADVETAGGVASDLNFEAYRRLGIGNVPGAQAEEEEAQSEAEPVSQPPVDEAESLLAPAKP